MHRLLSTVVLAACLAAPVSAQEVPTLDLVEVCKPGCIVLIVFDESAHFAADSQWAGEFTPTAVSSPLTYFDGMTVTETGQTVYLLQSERGMPMFSSIERVQEFMEGMNDLIDDQPAS